MSVLNPEALEIIFNGKVGFGEATTHLNHICNAANVPFNPTCLTFNETVGYIYKSKNIRDNEQLIPTLYDYVDDKPTLAINDQYDPVYESAYYTVTTNEFA